MSTKTGPELRRYELRVSPYERVASLLVSLLVLIGVAVLTMLILWLTSRVFAREPPVEVLMEDIGTGEGGLSGGTQLDEPMAEELGTETDLEQPALEQTLATVADAVSSQLAVLDDPALTEEMVPGRGGSTGDARGPYHGPGPGGGRPRRWEVRFPPGNTIETYARQLDFFGIELGVLMPQNKVIYASGFSQQVPNRREGAADEEKRYYLTWRQGALEQADRELLAKANIDTKGRLILKFLSPELELDLQQKEKARAAGEYNNVRTTYFGIRSRGGKYEFYVIDQTYK
jgi:hypothetical protein